MVEVLRGYKVTGKVWMVDLEVKIQQVMFKLGV